MTEVNFPPSRPVLEVKLRLGQKEVLQSCKARGMVISRCRAVPELDSRALVLSGLTSISAHWKQESRDKSPAAHARSLFAATL